MMVLRYLAYLPVNLVFVALAYLLSPLLALLSMATGPVLPGSLQWFSTTDDTLDGGQHQHPDIYPPATGFKLWWQRTCWICRNPAHGWQSNLLGFPADGTVVLSDRQKGPSRTVVMQTAKGKKFFSWRRDAKLGPFTLKTWFGWNPRAYDGRNHHYEFQPFGLKK